MDLVFILIVMPAFILAGSGFQLTWADSMGDTTASGSSSTKDDSAAIVIRYYDCTTITSASASGRNLLVGGF